MPDSDSMDWSTPGFPVLHYLPELAQTPVHRVSVAIQWSHPLLPTSPPALNLSQHQGLIQWISSSHQVAKSIGASASASVPPMNIEGWFPLRSTGLISLLSKELSRVFCSTTVRKHQFFSTQPSLWSIKKIWTIALTRWIFTSKWCLFFFNMLCRFVIAFLPKSEDLLILWLQSPSTMILKPEKIMSVVSIFFPIYLPWRDGTRCYDLSFLKGEF